MTKTGRASPKAGRGGIGDNHGFAEYAAITKALAVEQIDQEEMKKLRELRKTHRANAEGNRVDLSQLDDLYKRKDDPISDIIQHIKGKMYYLGAVFIPLRKQFDMFVQASESPEMQHAARHAGRMAGIKGLPASPPPNLNGEDQQLWLEGHGDGFKARNEASKERKQELADIMAQALKNAGEGKVTDGTGKNGPGAPAVKDADGRDPKAVAVGEKAKADFISDNTPVVGDDAQPPALPGEKVQPAESVAPPQPDWTGFDTDPGKWDETQTKAFERWFALISEDHVVQIDHVGVALAFRNYRDRGNVAEFKTDVGAEPAAEVELKDDPALDGDGEAPEVTAGAAPAGVVYMLSGDEPFASGRQSTYRDGKGFSSSIPGKLPVYDSHPEGFEMTAAELAKQSTRQAVRAQRQAAETPDPAEVAAAAEKLEASGFADGAKKRTRRAPAK